MTTCSVTDGDLRLSSRESDKILPITADPAFCAIHRRPIQRGGTSMLRVAMPGQPLTMFSSRILNGEFLMSSKKILNSSMPPSGPRTFSCSTRKGSSQALALGKDRQPSMLSAGQRARRDLTKFLMMCFEMCNYFWEGPLFRPFLHWTSLEAPKSVLEML